MRHVLFVSPSHPEKVLPSKSGTGPAAARQFRVSAKIIPAMGVFIFLLLSNDAETSCPAPKALTLDLGPWTLDFGSRRYSVSSKTLGIKRGRRNETAQS